MVVFFRVHQPTLNASKRWFQLISVEVASHLLRPSRLLGVLLLFRFVGMLVVSTLKIEDRGIKIGDEPYCWWFRNPQQPPGMVLKPCKWWDKLPTSTVAGFLPSTVWICNHLDHGFDIWDDFRCQFWPRRRIWMHFGKWLKLPLQSFTSQLIPWSSMISAVNI